MKIALYYAMPKELESLLAAKENSSPVRTVAGVSFYQIDDNLTAFAGGVGKVNAAMATQLCIALYSPDLIIDVGVAGCFQNVKIGTLILADKFVQHDVDTTGCGDPIGLVSTVNVTEFPTTDLDVAKRVLSRTGFDFMVGTGATGDWFAKSGERARWIAETYRPLFIEMEGAAVAQVCMRNATRFMAIKSVSDCLFGNERYDFNFPDAMRDLNVAVAKFVELLNADE